MTEYAMSAILNGGGSTKEPLKRILELREKLVKIGYNPDEVDYMIMSKSRERDIKKLEAADLRELQRALEEQLEIAAKCIEVV